MRQLFRKHLLAKSKILPLVVGAVITAFVFLNISRPVQAQAFKRAKVGDQAPGFSLNTPEKVTLSLKDFHGKVVALSFWKFSDKSEKELEFLNKAFSRYKDKEFEILAVYIPESDDKVSADEIKQLNKLISEKSLKFTVLIDKGMKVFSGYGVITLPSLALLDKTGKIVSIYPGFPKFTGEKQATEHIERALGIFKEVAKKKRKKRYQPKGKAAFHYKFGLRFFKLGFMKKAADKLEKALEEDPDFADAHILLAKIYAQQNKKDSAINEFNLAIAADVENVKVHIEYGKFVIENKMFEEALIAYETVKALKPKSGVGDFGLGQLYLAQEQHEEAITSFKKAIDLFSGKKSGKGDLFSMRKKAKAAKKGDPNLGPAYYGLALAQMKVGEKDKALQSFQKAIKNYQMTIKQIELELTTKEEEEQ